MQSDIVLSSRVRLARNYADLPFDLASEPEQAETCILRTLSALRQAGLEEQYDLLRLRDMSDVSRRAMRKVTSSAATCCAARKLPPCWSSATAASAS